MSDGDCLPRGGRGGGRGGRGGRRWNITSAESTLLCRSYQGLRPCYYPKHNYSPFNTEQIMRSVFHLTRYGRGGGGGGGHQSIGRPAPSPPGWLAVARQLTPEVLRWYSRIFKNFIWAYVCCWENKLFQAGKPVLERVRASWSQTHFGTNLPVKSFSASVCKTGGRGCTKSFGLGVKEGFLLSSKYVHGVRLSHYSVYHRC